MSSTNNSLLSSQKLNFENTQSEFQTLESFKINSDRQDLTFRFKKGRNSKSIKNLETEYFGLKDLSGVAIYESIQYIIIQFIGHGEIRKLKKNLLVKNKNLLK